MPDLSTLPTRGTLEYEAARVAAAFGVEGYTWSFRDDRIWWGDTSDYIGTSFKGRRVSWVFSDEGKLINITLAENEGFSTWAQVAYYNRWSVDTSFETSQVNAELAQSLYRLGFDDESILAELPALSAHEKLELRLSMPREFWPEAWLQEIGESAQGADPPATKAQL